MANETKKPIAALAELLGVGEYTEVNSIATEAIGEIEELRASMDMPGEERMLRLLRRVNDRDEQQCAEYADWLTKRDMGERDGFARNKVLNRTMAIVEGVLCNYDKVVDGHGNTHDMFDERTNICDKIRKEFNRVFWRKDDSRE